MPSRAVDAYLNRVSWLYQCFDRMPNGTREYRYLAEIARNPLARYWKPRGRGQPSLPERPGWVEEADKMLAERKAGHSAVKIGFAHGISDRTVYDWFLRRRKMLNR